MKKPVRKRPALDAEAQWQALQNLLAPVNSLLPLREPRPEEVTAARQVIGEHLSTRRQERDRLLGRFFAEVKAAHAAVKKASPPRPPSPASFPCRRENVPVKFQPDEKDGSENEDSGAALFRLLQARTARMEEPSGVQRQRQLSRTLLARELEEMTLARPDLNADECLVAASALAGFWAWPEWCRLNTYQRAGVEASRWAALAFFERAFPHYRSLFFDMDRKTYRTSKRVPRGTPQAAPLPANLLSSLFDLLADVERDPSPYHRQKAFEDLTEAWFVLESAINQAYWSRPEREGMEPWEPDPQDPE